MPTLHVSADEARRVKARRTRIKARNAVLYEVVDKIKARLKKADALEAATIESVLRDVRAMVRS